MDTHSNSIVGNSLYSREHSSSIVDSYSKQRLHRIRCTTVVRCTVVVVYQTTHTHYREGQLGRRTQYAYARRMVVTYCFGIVENSGIFF